MFVLSRDKLYISKSKNHLFHTSSLSEWRANYTVCTNNVYTDTSHSILECTDITVCLVTFTDHYLQKSIRIIVWQCFWAITHISHTVIHIFITWLTHKIDRGYWDTVDIFKWQLRRLKTIKGVQIKLAPVVLSYKQTQYNNTPSRHLILANNFGDKHLFVSE